MKLGINAIEDSLQGLTSVMTFPGNGYSGNLLAANKTRTDAEQIHFFLEAVRSGKPYPVKWAIDTYDLDVNVRDAQGKTAFMIAVEKGFLDIAAQILDRGGSINMSLRRDGTTALHKAIQRKEVNNVNWLIKRGADVNQTDREDKTPLMMAAEAGSLAIVKLLVEAGARIDPTTPKHRLTAFRLARKGGYWKICQYLNSHGALHNGRVAK